MLEHLHGAHVYDVLGELTLSLVNFGCERPAMHTQFIGPQQTSTNEEVNVE